MCAPTARTAPRGRFTIPACQMLVDVSARLSHNGRQRGFADLQRAQIVPIQLDQVTRSDDGRTPRSALIACSATLPRFGGTLLGPPLVRKSARLGPEDWAYKITLDILPITGCRAAVAAFGRIDSQRPSGPAGSIPWRVRQRVARSLPERWPAFPAVGEHLIGSRPSTGAR